ncbi:MAG TPA: anaerobic sulfite reductase subunit AsrB [Spirochaetia bacterium]|nr:anaerobic sulfite reductase subunit AsrB [Spirochaetia bacterium]
MNNPYRPERYEIISIERETAYDYTFRVAARLPVASGQFVAVSLPGVGEAPISVSDFGPDYIELTIRRVGHLTQALHDLRPGDGLFLRGPYGNGFPLEEFAGRRLLIVTGGSGLAPVKSLINCYYRTPGEVTELTLAAGFKSPQDVLFQRDLERWAGRLAVTVTVDQTCDGWSGQVGLVTACVKELNLVDPGQTRAIVVGPPLMMKFTLLELAKLGLAPEHIWVSLERRMSCGLGKCGHCKIDATYVCTDGPVFNYTRARKLID